MFARVGRINDLTYFATGDSSNIGLYDEDSSAGLFGFDSEMMLPIQRPGIDRLITFVRYLLIHKYEYTSILIIFRITALIETVIYIYLVYVYL